MESIEQLLKMEKSERDKIVEEMNEAEQWDLLFSLLSIAPRIDNNIKRSL